MGEGMKRANAAARATRAKNAKQTAPAANNGKTKARPARNNKSVSPADPPLVVRGPKSNGGSGQAYQTERPASDTRKKSDARLGIKVAAVGGRGGGKTASMQAEMEGRSRVLPNTLFAHVPSALAVIETLTHLGTAIGMLEKELYQAQQKGTTALARSFVVLHNLHGRIDEVSKGFSAIFQGYKVGVLPAAFEQEGVPHVPLDEGYRVGVSSTLYASIIGGQKDAAMAWLKKNGLGDLIQESINSSSLSATARNLREEQNIDLPGDIFKCTDVHNTSVTRTK